MARLVPSLEIINGFPKQLEPGERTLMEALLNILDDDWTIYVQPNLNGIQPDIIIFSEEGGLGIFEVKDWNLDAYRVKVGGRWDVYDGRQGRWFDSKVRCPVSQVQSYKDDIYRYELPELEAEKILNEQVYALIAPYVYFHCHTTQDARSRTKSVHHPYVTIFGYDDLQPSRLRALLDKRYLKKGSYFSEMMKRYGLQKRLLNALDYPEHGRLDVSDILFPLTKDQKKILSNEPGKRRAIGVAGSGKTLLLVRKAVNAAINGQKVLIVCFNLTMINYLRDVVRRLARHKSRNHQQLLELIIVRHYHRLFPADIDDESEETDLDRANQEEVGISDIIEESQLFDVILIDEGQDFKRKWIERLYELAFENAHVMFVEDDRQNIYGINTKARASVPGILGRPNELKHSFRINREVATLANLLVKWSKAEFDSGDIEIRPSSQTELIAMPKPIWIQGAPETLLDELAGAVRRLIVENRSGALADLVILVCTVEDGWEICESLKAMHLPFICNFESREEYERLAEKYGGDQLKDKRKQIRRARKIAFHMQTGRIKVCTIHSFKGWELKRVLVYFRPAEKQADRKIALLYTAITRTQDSLMLFNADPMLSDFGRLAGQEGLVEFQEPDPDWVNRPQPDRLWLDTSLSSDHENGLFFDTPTTVEPYWDDEMGALP